MELLIDCALRNILITRKDLFGEECTYLKFEPDDEKYDWSSGYQSTSLFGRIVFRRNEKIHHSDYFVLKITPPRPFTKAFSLLHFSNEVFFYTRILPFFENYREIGHLFPRYYNSVLQYGVNTDEAVLIFENIQARGYIPAKSKSYLDYEHLSLMLKKLGEFHAYSYHAKQRNSDLFHALCSTLSETNFIKLKQEAHSAVSVTFNRGLQPLLNNSRYSSYGQKLRNIFDDFDEVYDRALTADEKNHAHVLCHSDFMRSNVLFRYDSNGKPVDLKIVDLATCRLASPVVDLVTVLYLNADQQMRNENWDTLIDDYYAALENTFPSSNVPSKDSIVAEFKKNYAAIYAYFVASYFLPMCIAQNAPEQTDLHREYVDFKEKLTRNDFLDHTKEALLKVGGQSADVELSNILRDIIDRDFV